MFERRVVLIRPRSGTVPAEDSIDGDKRP